MFVQLHKCECLYCKETGAWQHLVELLVQPPDQVGLVHFCYKSLCPAEVVGQYLSPFQDSLPGLGLEAGQARPPDLETAVAVLEAHGDQVRPINIKNISNKDFFKYSKQGGACPGACQLARLHLLAQAGRLPHWVSGGQVGLQS